MRTKTKPVLPTGLVYHCDTCGVVIPGDAPTPDAPSCAWVVANKMAWFNPATAWAASAGDVIAAVSRFERRLPTKKTEKQAGVLAFYRRRNFAAIDCDECI